MERMTIKAYATKHKLSMFNVVKMVKSGQLRSETVEENGKEVTYVLAGRREKEKPDREATDTEQPESGNGPEERISVLEREVAILKRELDALKISMGIRG
jgi:hypothetical protein